MPLKNFITFVDVFFSPAGEILTGEMCLKQPPLSTRHLKLTPIQTPFLRIHIV